MSDKHSKTEDATPKRIRDAKRKGQGPKSTDLGPALSLLIFIFMSGLLGNYVFKRVLIFLKRSLTADFNTVVDVAYVRTNFIDNMLTGMMIVIPIALISIALGLAVSIAQTGFIITGEPIKPDLNKINPIQGFKNIFSKKVLFNLLKNLLKLFLVFYLAYKGLKDSFVMIINTSGIGTEKMFQFFTGFVRSLVTTIAYVMVLLGVADLIFQRREFKIRLRMTKQEIKDEYKEMEGSPEVKSARRQRQRQLAMGRMMANVPEATVVVTNPTHVAVALRYDKSKDEAPILLAKGLDKVAGRIKETAKDHKIPIMENKELARTIYREVEIGEYVPADLYKAVAEILALVYQLQEKNKGKI